MTCAFNFVLFGATGDLAMRKILPALFAAHRDGKLHPDGRIVCVAQQSHLRQAYLDWMNVYVAAQVKGAAADLPCSESWKHFQQRIIYLTLDARQASDYGRLAAMLEDGSSVNVFFLATSTYLFECICANLRNSGIDLSTARVVLEKPLGHDLASSHVINDAVARVFAENQIYRVDHYLGKESVQNLLVLRFANRLFEPIWRRESIAHVQLTIAEQLGVEGRGEFYDSTGALRDMVQNHLLQLLCMVAMEPPNSLDADAVRNEKIRVLQALRPFTGQDLDRRAVRGQYADGLVSGEPVIAYADENGIAPQSQTETFVALHAEINNWRWAGVPFFLRTGKRLATRTAEIEITFRPVPHAIVPVPGGAAAGNRLVITLQPEESIRLYCMVKQPGDGMAVQEVALDLAFDQAFKQQRAEAYERLLLDAIRGDLSLFVRRDEQEAAWHWVEPLLQHWQRCAAPVARYPAGSWGPKASTEMMARAGAEWPEDC